LRAGQRSIGAKQRLYDVSRCQPEKSGKGVAHRRGFGLGWNRIEIVSLTAFAYLIPFWFWFWIGLGLSAWILLPLLTLPRAVTVARTVSSTERFEDLFPMTPKASFLSVYYRLLSGVGIALAG
jgi:1,4-dihydroxy-2-naphthoate polyprenyltransferase